MSDWKQDFLHLGKRLRSLREKRNLSASITAQRLQIPLSTYREWENGRAIRGLPYARLAEIFEISLHELLTGKKIENQQLLESVRAIEKELDKLKKDLNSLF